MEQSQGLDNPAFNKGEVCPPEGPDQTPQSQSEKSSIEDRQNYQDADSNSLQAAKCGIGPCQLGFFHRFAKIQWFVVVLGVYSFVEGASINGFVNISLTTLETRFQLKSSETGLIVSSADIGAIVFVLFVSYYGSKTHQPRVVGVGCLIMALGAFLFLLPHLLVGKYTFTSGGNGTSHVCDPARADVCVSGQNQQPSESAYLPLFAIAQAVQGIGFTPAFTVGAAYIDDHTTPEKTAFYMGIVYALTALGVAAGFMTGGQLLNIWVDVGRVDTSGLDLEPSDKRWVGAWWIGFVVTCGLFIALTLPLCAFPSKLPGAVALVGGAGGMVLGGWLIRRFHLQLPGIVKLCMAMAVLSLVLGAGFFLNCPDSKFAGLNWDYAQNTPKSDALTGTCNVDCNCNTQEFEPVCGSDGVTYFSPCHAGCNGSVLTAAFTKTFINCSCIHTGGSSPGNITSQAGLSLEAVNGQCGKDCSLVWLFVVLLFCAFLATFTTVTPISMAVLRCAPGAERSLGLGIQWVSLRLLGTIPGPVLTGAVLDSSCILWQNTCDGQGNCWVYDRQTMSWSLFLWWAMVKVFNFTLLFIALQVYKRQQKVGMVSEGGGTNFEIGDKAS